MTAATYFDRATGDHYKAEVVEHTRSRYGDEQVTFDLEYPAFVHPEVMTYASAERSVASFRAIPSVRLLKRVKETPVLPLVWLENQKGMQGGAEIVDREPLDEIVRLMADCAVAGCEELLARKVHKQHLNRYLVPWLTMKTVFTTSKRMLGHLLSQRRHPKAQPEFQRLAELMLQAFRGSRPRALGETLPETPGRRLPLLYKYMDGNLGDGAWVRRFSDLDPCDLHAPFVPLDQRQTLEQTVVQSVARCARVSYEKHDATGEKTGRLSTLEEDAELFGTLLMPDDDPTEPKHIAPTGHVLFAEPSDWFYGVPTVGKFPGFVQFRKLCKQEVCEFDWAAYGVEP